MKVANYKSVSYKIDESKLCTKQAYLKDHEHSLSNFVRFY